MIIRRGDRSRKAEATCGKGPSRLGGQKSRRKAWTPRYFSAAGSGGVVFGGARWCVACS